MILPCRQHRYSLSSLERCAKCHRMITKDQIKRAVDGAEESFRKCWAKLLVIKSTTADGKARLDAIVSFQPGLAEGLYKLTKLYNSISQERKSLIRKSQNHPRKLN